VRVNGTRANPTLEFPQLCNEWTQARYPSVSRQIRALGSDAGPWCNPLIRRGGLTRKCCRGITFLDRYNDEELLVIRGFLRGARTLITERADALREKRPADEKISHAQLARRGSRHADV